MNAGSFLVAFLNFIPSKTIFTILVHGVPSSYFMKFYSIFNFWLCCTTFLLLLASSDDRAWKTTYVVQIWRCGTTVFINNCGNKNQYTKKTVNFCPEIAVFCRLLSLFQCKKFRFVENSKFWVRESILH